jgi:dihydroneopterin aldolase
MANKVREIWENPKHREDSDRNVWNLYNAVTQHLTHEVAPKRFELAERVGDAVVAQLAGNIRNIESLFAESTLEDAELN